MLEDYNSSPRIGKKVRIMDEQIVKRFNLLTCDKYLDMTNDKMKKIIDNKNLKIINSWISNDNLSRQEKWINFKI